MFKVIANCCLVLLACVACCVSLAYGYYHCFVRVHQNVVGVNHIGDQVALDIKAKIESGELSEEEKAKLEDRVFINVNYYSNDKNNGFMLQELQFNYYTDYSLNSSAYRSTGMQHTGNEFSGQLLTTWKGSHIAINLWESEKDRYMSTDSSTVNFVNDYINTEDFYYYDSSNGITYDGITNENGSVATELKRNTSFVVNIGDKPFLIKLNKYKDVVVGRLMKHIVFSWDVGKVYNRYYYTFESLFEACMKAVKTNDHQYGDYYVELNLSDMFTVYSFENGKFVEDDISDEIFTGVLVKFHYDENGARNSKQSLFGIIEDNPAYDAEKSDVDTAYWQARMVYNLTAKNFDLRYSDIYDGYFASLNMDTKSLFDEMPRTKVNVVIDTLCKDKKIVGIDYNGFENFEIDTLTIKGAGQFYLLNKSLYNTKIQTLKHGADLSLDISEDVFSNEYAEVIA